MARLDSLPDETLLQILSYLRKSWRTHRCHDNCDLFHIALVSHRFGNLARPVLARRVYLDLLQAPAQCEKFARTLQESPAVASMVYDFDYFWTGVNQDHHDRANILLAKLCNVKTLIITAIRDEVPFEPTFLSSMKHLSRLKIEDSNLIVSCMSRYLFHDSLRSLELLWLEDKDVFPLLPVGYTPGSSPLLHLVMGHAFHLTEPVLTEVLRWPRALETLQCRQIAKDIQEPRRWRLMDWQLPTTPFSPAGMGRALKSVAHSLKELCLISSQCSSLMTHDTSKLDLSMMKELRRLDLRMEWFFMSIEEREYFYKLLPPKLEVLKVRINLVSSPLPIPDAHNAYLYFVKLHLGLTGYGVTRAEVEDGNGDEEEEVCPDLLWLMNIALNKHEYFPDLLEVHLDERRTGMRGADGYLLHQWARTWKPPVVVMQAFAKANIMLIAKVLKNDTNGKTKRPSGGADPFISMARCLAGVPLSPTA